MSSAFAQQVDAHRAALDHLISAVMVSHTHSDADTLSLFEGEPTVTSDLGKIFAEMEAAGYEIGTPQRQAHCAKNWHTEWHVPITKDDLTWLMAFQIPGDVS